MTPADIQLLFDAAGATSAFPAQNGATVLPGAAPDLTDAEKARRTAGLQQVLLAVQQYWISGSPSMDMAAEILGDGSRDGKSHLGALPSTRGAVRCAPVA